MKKKVLSLCLMVLTLVGLSSSKISSEGCNLLSLPETVCIIVRVCNPNGIALSGADIYANGVYVGTSSDDPIIVEVEKGTEVTITAYKDGYQMIAHEFSKTHFTEEETLSEPECGCFYAFVILAPIE